MTADQQKNEAIEALGIRLVQLLKESDLSVLKQEEIIASIDQLQFTELLSLYEELEAKAVVKQTNELDKNLERDLLALTQVYNQKQAELDSELLRQVTEIEKTL